MRLGKLTTASNISAFLRGLVPNTFFLPQHRPRSQCQIFPQLWLKLGTSGGFLRRFNRSQPFYPKPSSVPSTSPTQRTKRRLRQFHVVVFHDTGDTSSGHFCCREFYAPRGSPSENRQAYKYESQKVFRPGHPDLIAIPNLGFVNLEWLARNFANSRISI